MNNFNDYTLIPYPQIAERTGVKMQDYESQVYFQNIPNSDAVYSHPDENVFAVYQGDTKMDSLDLTLAGYKTDRRAILVIGDLVVKDAINLFGTDVGYPMYLYVTGNLKAENLLISQLADVIVKGDITVKSTLLNIDVTCGNLYCGGNYMGKNVYLEKAGMDVKRNLTAENFYYYVNIGRTEDNRTPLKDLNIEIGGDKQFTAMPCGESGICFFSEMLEIEEGLIDLDSISSEEKTRINNLYKVNQVFIDELYKGNDLRSHSIPEKIMAGIKVFK
ncbi:hypothetical protein ECE50_004030 [Chitinophaga sp. Mgbs1]|uniref:Uncharacterized protein n=1 Tax=Chitinophaga solisilvae TaxID=1233460 RepID=A0A3S1AUS1_9BACT|nr:hypothetical protein [Chitinophaga solisilvae]